jgi:hypothetical protein
MRQYSYRCQHAELANLQLTETRTPPYALRFNVLNARLASETGPGEVEDTQ